MFGGNFSKNFGMGMGQQAPQQRSGIDPRIINAFSRIMPPQAKPAMPQPAMPMQPPQAAQPVMPGPSPFNMGSPNAQQMNFGQRIRELLMGLRAGQPMTGLMNPGGQMVMPGGSGGSPSGGAY